MSGVKNESVRKLVKDTFGLHDSEPVRIEFLSSYPRQNGVTEYEFNAIFEYKNDWCDNGIVEKFVTVSIRDDY